MMVIGVRKGGLKLTTHDLFHAFKKGGMFFGFYQAYQQ